MHGVKFLVYYFEHELFHVIQIVDILESASHELEHGYQRDGEHFEDFKMSDLELIHALKNVPYR